MKRHEATKQRSDKGVVARGGMTLVEILAVVVILGLIAATLLVGFSGTFDGLLSAKSRSGDGAG